MLAGLNRTLDEWLCDSFVELIEEMELWKWDDATGDFWSRLAKALQQSNISVTWAEQLDSRLASVHTTEQHLSHVGRAVGQQTGISSYHWKTELGCSN